MHLTFLNNNLESWALAVAISLGVTLALYWVRRFVLHRLQAAPQRTDALAEISVNELLAQMLRKTYIFIMLAMAAYLGSLALELSDKQHLIVSRVAVAALILQLAIWGDTLLRAWRDHYIASDGRKASRTIIVFLSRLALWVVAFLMVLDNFGFNITALVASLGVGGIAVALAVQNILGDLFASLSIMLDKPFEIGDFIIVGDVLGSVEHIGLKTTRLRGLGGEQVIFSNGDLLKSRIHNHKRMETRRVAFVLRVAYGSSEQQLARIPELIREVVAAAPQGRIRARALLQLRRVVAQFRGGVPLPEPGLHRAHGYPAGDFARDLPQLRARRDTVCASLVDRAAGGWGRRRTASRDGAAVESVFSTLRARGVVRWALRAHAVRAAPKFAAVRRRSKQKR